jgi:hypothetical protein
MAGTLAKTRAATAWWQYANRSVPVGVGAVVWPNPALVEDVVVPQ